MSEACEHIDNCKFFAKFGERKSNVWRGLVSFYCRGSGHRLCERRKGYRDGRDCLAVDIMPTGQEASRAFQSLP